MLESLPQQMWYRLLIQEGPLDHKDLSVVVWSILSARSRPSARLEAAAHNREYKASRVDLVRRGHGFNHF